MTLLHICCAPCALMCIESLRGEGIEPFGFWYNHNIHPFTEYKARYETLAGYAEKIGMELISEGRYDVGRFTAAVSAGIPARCGFCYSVRLDEAARRAKEGGFSSFTTTLLISPYQKHDMIRLEAEKAAEKYGAQFLYRDFRPLFREGQRRAREEGFYMQKYCGCIYSEQERYQKQIDKLGD